MLRVLSLLLGLLLLGLLLLVIVPLPSTAPNIRVEVVCARKGARLAMFVCAVLLEPVLCGLVQQLW